jgi:hypothetical protein
METETRTLKSKSLCNDPASKAKLTLIVGVGTLTALLLLTQLTTMVYAWRLDVDLSRSTFGSDRVCAEVHGPYGHDERNCTESGPNASVSFEIPENEVPNGSRYQVCAWGGLVSTFLPNCHYFNHDSGDESVWLDVGR